MKIAPRAIFYHNLSLTAKDFTRTQCGYHLAAGKISYFAHGEIYHCPA